MVPVPTGMDPSSWKQVEQLYHAALEFQPGERAAFGRENGWEWWVVLRTGVRDNDV
jgi:hypothetical protein